MGTIHIVHYNKVKRVDVSINRYNLGVGVDICPDFYGVGWTRGKVAVLSPDIDIRVKLDGILRCRPFNMVQNVYMSSKCLTPRDLVRRSFTLVRDKSNADCICVPRGVYDVYSKLVSGIITYKNPTTGNTTLYMMCLNAVPVAVKDMWVGEIRESILSDLASKELLDKGALQVLWMADFTNSKSMADAWLDAKSLFFLPDVPEYFEILDGTKLNKTYTYEDNLDYSTPAVITPDNLYIWRRINDLSLFQRTIALCDWKRYPVTFAALIDVRVPRYERYFGRWERSIQVALKTLNIETLLAVLDGNDQTPIMTSAEDMNMLQDWIFKELGLEGENCGFVTSKKLKQAPPVFRYFLKRKYAVTKMSFNKPINLQEIKQNCY